jgi:selenocysteine lyase/cysteine desulfurase
MVHIGSVLPTPPATAEDVMSELKTRRAFLRSLSATVAAPVAAQLLAADEMFARELEALAPSRDVPLRFQGFADRYLLDPRVTYLNHASIGTIPRAVHAAGMRYREVCEENPWLYIWGGAWEEAREEVRTQSATLMRCDPRGLAITHNTTEGFNLLAQGLPLGSRDEILFSSLNHPGASICWEHFAPVRGYSVRTFDFPLSDVFEMSAEDVVRIHQEQIRAETRALVFPHIDNIVGLRHPLPELVAMARANGVEYVLVDGAQSAGMIPLALSDAGVDVYSTSPHKWIQSPKGLGLLYVRPELLEVLRPMWVTWGQERWRGTARVYEDYGTRAFPEVLSLGDSLDFQAALGESRKEQRYRELFEFFMDAVDATPGLTWRSPRMWEMGGILTAVQLLDQPADQASEALFRDHGIVLRPFPQDNLNSLRVSPNLVNTESELARLLSILDGELLT